MCPPTTPNSTGAKNRTSAATSTVSDVHKLIDIAAKKKGFLGACKLFKSDATQSKKISRCSASKPTKGYSKRVALTIPTMALILLACSAFSFFVGCFVRYSRHIDSVSLFSTNDGVVSTTGASIPTGSNMFDNAMDNAVPISWAFDIQSDRGYIDTHYSFKNFIGNQLSNTVVSSNSVFLMEDGTFSYIAQEPSFHQNVTAARKHTAVMEDESSSYEPSGQHILVDIENVDRDFLRSEQRLTHAMMELIQGRTNMTLLSYHCHSNVHRTMMGGISCAGILLESHVSFHTFPIFGSISFDLFSCGKSSLISTLPDVRELFAVATPIVPRPDEYDNLWSDLIITEQTLQRQNYTTSKTTRTIASEADQPLVKWTYKRRGFRNTYKVKSSLTKIVSVAEELPDLHWMISMGNLDKTHVATVQTDFQRIDIFDIKMFHTRPTNEIDRVVYLDGIIQSRLIGEKAYHEALVHPIMVCHDSPKRVIIIGGGEGATLREVLKHNTVEEVIMVEIDELMVLTSQMYLPEWNTCENGISCFDDPRATTYFTDAIAWFIHRFGENSTIYDENDVFDIIIMDALDPDSVLEFSDFLYKNRDLMLAFSRALGDSGIFVAQVGEDENMDDLPHSFDPDNPFSVFLDGLESFGFESIVDYSESHGRFIESWGFVVAMKDSNSRSNWLRNEAEINLEIVRRITPATPLVFFDGATMMNYQFASRITQEIWCRDKVNGECSTGQGFDPFASTIPHTAFNVKPSTVNKGGRGVFSAEFVPKGTVIGLEECVNGMFIPSTTFKLLRDAAHEFDENDESDDAVSDFWDVVYFGYVDGYGWIDSFYGLPAGGVDPGKMTFVNHGCNSTYNVGTPLDINELTAPLGVGPGDAYDDVNEVYNPYNDRRFPMWECEKFVALRDIEKDEELFDNYLVFGGGDNIDDWDKNLMELKSVCMGKSGTIAEYEAAAMRNDDESA